MSRQKGPNRAALGLLIVPIGIVVALIFYSGRTHPKPRGSLVDSAKNEDLSSVQAHVEDGASVNSISSSGHSAIYAAAANGDLQMVQYLLQKGASPNAETRGKNTPLDAAAMAGDLAIVKALVAGGAELKPYSTDGETPLHAAASGGNAKVIEFLLDKGLDPNAVRTSDHATPICDAASAGHWDAINSLRKGGGNIDTPGFHKRTPLSLTILTHHRSVARELLAAGADINIADTDGAKPLHFSLVLGDYELTRMLLPKTKDVGAYLRGGRNALYDAVFYRAPLDIDEALMKAGCAVEQKVNNETLIDIAKANKDEALLALLKRYSKESK